MKQILSILFFMLINLNATYAETLIVGCRPWDQNIQTVKQLDRYHFLDCLIDEQAPADLPENFSLIDINSQDTFGAGNFSDFAEHNSKKFDTIIIDWFTEQHLMWKDVCVHFKKILKPGGRLIIPVSCYSLLERKPISLPEAQRFIHNILQHEFSTVEIRNRDTLPDEAVFDILRRDLSQKIPGLSINDYEPVIIFVRP